MRIDTAAKPRWIAPITEELTGTSIIDTNYAIKIPAGTTVYTGFKDGKIQTMMPCDIKSFYNFNKEFKFMESYEIEEIFGDGYERWAKIKIDSCLDGVFVHFIEYDEYLENTTIPSKRKKHDTINGNLKISLVTEYKVIDEDINGFIQAINKSSNITAIATVKEIDDSDTIVCRIKNLSDDIVVEFEDDVEVEVDTTIEVHGSLEIEI